MNVEKEAFGPTGRFKIELLSPKGIPGAEAEIVKAGEGLSGTYIENGVSKKMEGLYFDGEKLGWIVSIGEKGDENFVFTLTLYPGNWLLGGADAGRGPSPVVYRRLDDGELTDISELYVTISSGPSGDMPPMGGAPDGHPPMGGTPGGMPPQNGRPPMGGGAPDGMPPLGGQPPMDVGAGSESFELKGRYIIRLLHPEIFPKATAEFIAKDGEIQGIYTEENQTSKVLSDVRCDGKTCGWTAMLGRDGDLRLSFSLGMYHQNVLVGYAEGENGIIPVVGRLITE